MPDEFFRRDISELLPVFDYYVSSAIAGYRKPSCKGLEMIAEKYDVPISELIFVGDEDKDMSTAVNAGCRFVRVCRMETRGDSISSLRELLYRLECEERI